MSYKPLQFEMFPAHADQVAGNQTPNSPEIAAEQKAAKARPEKPKKPRKVPVPEQPGAGSIVPAVKFLPVRAVANRYSVSRATIWRWVQLREGFPQGRHLSARCTRWCVAELDAFDARIAAEEQA